MNKQSMYKNQPNATIGLRILLTPYTTTKQYESVSAEFAQPAFFFPLPEAARVFSPFSFVCILVTYFYI